MAEFSFCVSGHTHNATQQSFLQQSYAALLSTLASSGFSRIGSTQVGLANWSVEAVFESAGSFTEQLQQEFDMLPFIATWTQLLADNHISIERASLFGNYLNHVLALPS